MMDAPISQTAVFMAFFRALESRRPAAERLFEDRFATAFLGLRLRRVARLARHSLLRAAVETSIDALWPGARPAGIARTRMIDDEFERALAPGAGEPIEQVVLLGAGFDARAHRLPCLRGTPVIEVDSPATLEHKRRCIEPLSAGASAPRIQVPIDFDREPLPDALAKVGFDATRRSFFLWEGVTNYLTAKAVDAVLRFVGSAAPGSRLFFTYVHREVLGEAARFRGSWLLRHTLRRSRESWSFGLDPARLESTLREHGLLLIRDEGSFEYRKRLLGDRERSPRGYEFYRAALASVAP